MNDATRDRILDAVERLLGRLGYAKMGMEDIAREAGVGRRTIYLYFPGKEEVALASIDRIVERLKERLRAVAASAEPPAAKLRGMLLLRVLFRVDSVRDYHHSIDDIYRSLRPAYLARRERYLREEAAILAGVLEEGVASGGMALPEHGGGPAGVAHTLLLATNALLPTSLSPRELGERSEVEARAARIADLLLQGLVARSPDPHRAPRPRSSANRA